MATSDMSPERTRAYYKFREAEQQAHKKHFERALELAHEALEIDPTYTEVRLWIADLYRQLDQPRRASLIYQEIIHQDRANEQAWAGLRAVDPIAAERLERLQHIAPDPFVAQRQAAGLEEELEDLASLAEELTGEEAPAEEEILATEVEVEDLSQVAETGGVQAMLEAEVGGIVGVTPATGAAEKVGAEDLGAQTTEAAQPAQEAGGASATEATEEAAQALEADPSEWLFEEDLPYRRKIAQHPVYTELLPEIVEFWKDNDAWDVAIRGSVHLDPKRHPGVVEVCREVEAKLGAPEPWNLYVCPERRMISTITRGSPPTISLTTGCLNALSHEELVFMMGRFTTMLVAGHIPFLQITMLTLERNPRTITDVEIDMLELLRNHHAGWDAMVHREEKIKLGQLCHAWQLRAELSADRGGLICCGNLEVACNAIAKLVAPDSNAAKTATMASLGQKFQGQDLAKLAAIPPKEDPQRNEGYGWYRIQMLRWWAKTPQAQALWRR